MNNMTNAMKTVYTMLIDTNGEGPAGDGTVIVRFRNQKKALAYAAAHTCYGRPVKVSEESVPARIASRWSYCG
jgi:hypothetical protein